MRTHLLSFLLPAAAALAQTPPNLVALTLLGNQIWEGTHNPCAQIGLCTAPGLTSTLQFLWQGGIAYDARSDATWASDGSTIVSTDPSTCAIVCAPQNCPRTPGSDVCGLDVYDNGNQLWIIDSAAVITRVGNDCNLTFAQSHVIAPLGAHTPTGISVDEARGLVFYSAVDFASGTGDGRIYMAPLTNPGAWFGFWNVVDCFSTANHRITGLAVDGGNPAIFWTDGRNTYRATFTYTGTPGPGSVVITAGTCCMMQNPGGDPFLDLGIRWGAATSTGAPCANGACLPCPNIHVLRNAPLVGTNLQLGLDFAQFGVPYWCVMNIGSCQTTGPSFPPLCGPLLVPVNAAMFANGFGMQVGGVGCGASITLIQPLPAPPPSLVGLPMASQFVGLCPTGGSSMSNCLSWVLQ